MSSEWLNTIIVSQNTTSKMTKIQLSTFKSNQNHFGYCSLAAGLSNQINRNLKKKATKLKQINILKKPRIEKRQALADISRSALCCHSNETRTPIANQPNSVQLESTPIIPPTYTRVRAVVWECGDGQTDRQTHRHRRRVTIYISPRLRLTRSVIKNPE